MASQRSPCAATPTQFATRCGHGTRSMKESKRSPIFLQWVEAVWQLVQQFPAHFEFNEQLLTALMDLMYACRFGNFLFNSEMVRREENLESRTQSLWQHLRRYSDRFRSPTFGIVESAQSKEQPPLIPIRSGKQIRIWRSYHLRWDTG